MGWKKPKLEWRNWAWHAGAMLLFYLLSNGMFSLFHDGYSLNQMDVTHFRGMAQERISNYVLTGENTDWSNSMFGGMPTYQTGGGSGGFTWAIWLKESLTGLFASVEIATLFFAMFSAYLLALALGLAPWWALISGVGFGLSSLGILYLGAGHRSKVNAIAFMPGVVAGVIWSYRNDLWKGLAVIVLFTSFHLAANHLQMTYYLLFLLGAIVIALGVKAVLSKELKRFAQVTSWVALAGVLASLPNAMVILNTQSYSKHTTRGEAVVNYDESGVLMGSDGKSYQANLELGAGTNSGEGLDVEYILEYSMSKMEWLSVISPNFKGGGERVPMNINGQRVPVPAYWGEQKFSGGAFYFGAIIMAFFFAFLLAGRHWLRWPFLAVSALAVVLSWREMTLVMDLFIHHVPLFGKFRDTKMMLVVMQVMAGAGAVLFMSELADLGQQNRSDSEEKKSWQKRVKVVMASFAGIFGLFALFYIAPTALLDFEPALRPDPLKGALSASQIEAMRIEVFRGDVLRTLGLLFVAASAAWLLMWGKVKAPYIAVVLLVIQTFDLWSVDGRYHSNEVVPGQRSAWVPNSASMYPFVPNAAHLSILEQEREESPEFLESKSLLFQFHKNRFPRRMRPDDQQLLTQIAEFEALRAENAPFRVVNFNSPMADAETSYFFQSIGGYHGAKLQRYNDYFDLVLQKELQGLSAAAASGEIDKGLEAMWGHRMLNTKYVIASEEMALPLPPSPGPAWFVDEVEWVETSNDELLSTRLLSGFNRAIVPLSMKKSMAFTGEPGAHQVQLVQHDPEFIAYDVQSENGGVLVCSEVYYPDGWKVLIDDEPAPLLRANFILRAVSVPPGQHRVTMQFEGAPSSYSAIATAGGVFSLLFLLFASVFSFREENAKAAA